MKIGQSSQGRTCTLAEEWIIGYVGFLIWIAALETTSAVFLGNRNPTSHRLSQSLNHKGRQENMPDGYLK